MRTRVEGSKILLQDGLEVRKKIDRCRRVNQASLRFFCLSDVLTVIPLVTCVFAGSRSTNTSETDGAEFKMQLHVRGSRGVRVLQISSTTGVVS